MLIAETGTGKEAIKSGTSALLNHVEGALDFNGPSNFASALESYIFDRPSFFGSRLQQMSNRKCINEFWLRTVLLDLYNKSGNYNSYNGSAHANKENSKRAVKSPSVTIIGETTRSTLDESLISDGLLPRFIVIEYTGNRPPLNKSHENALLSPDLINNFM